MEDTSVKNLPVGKYIFIMSLRLNERPATWPDVAVSSFPSFSYFSIIFPLVKKNDNNKFSFLFIFLFTSSSSSSSSSSPPPPSSAFRIILLLFSPSHLLPILLLFLFFVRSVA